METLQSTISPIGDTAPFKKCLADEKKPSIKSQTEESNYADLSNSSVMKTDGTKTVKVTFTGEGSQLAVFKCQSDTSTVGDGSPGKRKEKGNITQTPSKDRHQDHSKNAKVGECESFVSSTSPDNEISESEMPTTETDPQTEIILQDYNPQNVSYESEELRYTDMYLNSQSESEDGSSSVVLSDQSTVNTFADESHYITTHEIQLTELDHDVDYEIGRGPCWDYEDDNLVYSFVDYASFESDETTESTLILDGKVGKAKISKGQSVNAGQRGTGRAPGSTESDVCDSDKCVSSDESICKHLNETSGQIHLSIETSSRAINANNTQENETNCYRARRTGERSEYFFQGSDSSREAVFDRAHYFIPAPGRQHLAPQLKGKDINEYSSGASSSISELDDADKEVRNLTAKSFRSLACPYFDAINLSTSSESSISEHGIDFNKWSAMFDLNYGNMNRGREKRLISHRSSTFEVNKNPGCKNIVEVGDLKEAQTKSCPHKKQARSNFQKESSSTKKIEIREQYDNQGQGEMITLTETLNFSCNVEAGLPTCQRRAKCVENTTGSRSADEVTGIMPSRPGSAGANPHSDCGDTLDDTYKKAVFASSLLKNVISKKMQFEQERKMERGEIRDTHSAQSPCFQSGDPDTSKESDHCKCEQRQESETDSGPVALHELGDVVDTLSNIDPREQQGQCATTTAEPTVESQGGVMCKSNKDICDTKAVTLPQSEKSAFKSYKDGEQSGNVEPGNDKEEATTDMIPPTVRISEKHKSPPVSGKLTKMSHLYVPSSHLLFKDREEEQHTQDKNIHDGVTEQGEDECSREKNLCNLHRSAVLQASKAPEIKIRLRSVKDNKSHPFNIANLLTPNIGLTSTYPLKVVSESKCQMPSASDRVPHFTVRDIRESKGKFQTPIHQVRDVRKLVKSSYRFVALENAENKAVSSTSLLSEDKVGLFKKEPDKKPPQSPMIIKCHSVNTNNARKQCRYAPETPKRGQVECPSELDRLSPKPLADSIRNDSVFATRSAGRTPCVKQPYVDSAELKMETKAVKQRQDKTVETVEKKSESKVTNQAALEKLKAAVKTMEQLYVFDRNEWKRKTQAPHPVTDSHVLSLITSEEQGGPTKTELEVELGKGFENERSLSSIINPPALASTLLPGVAHSTDDKVNFKLGIYGQEDTSTSKSFNVHAERFNNKCEVNVGSSLKTPVCSASSNNSVKQSCSAQQGIQPNSKTITHTFKKSPLSVNITSPKQEAEEKSLIKSAETSLQAQAAKLAQAETENYLTIPVKACPTDTSASSASTTASRKLGSPLESSQPGTSSQQMSLKRSPIIMESWAPESPTGTTIYHHSLPIPLAATAPQVFCIPPSLVSTVTDPMQQQQLQTQKKMLLDPTTGHYYLVDTPVQPATKRLYDPETGQYVDVPVPPPQPLTPVPMPISPLALSPGAAFAPTYMIYPGLMASPTAFTSQSLSSSTQSEGDAERLQGKDTGTQTSTGATYPLGHSPVARGVGAVPGTSGTKPPVISITAQQGPRIIAPPSFDGTTMSFVVEHR